MLWSTRRHGRGSSEAIICEHERRCSVIFQTSKGILVNLANISVKQVFNEGGGGNGSAKFTLPTGQHQVVQMTVAEHETMLNMLHDAKMSVRLEVEDRKPRARIIDPVEEAVEEPEPEDLVQDKTMTRSERMKAIHLEKKRLAQEAARMGLILDGRLGPKAMKKRIANFKHSKKQKMAAAEVDAVTE
jgi:hypothetical protein